MLRLQPPNASLYRDQLRELEELGQRRMWSCAGLRDSLGRAAGTSPRLTLPVEMTTHKHATGSTAHHEGSKRAVIERFNPELH